MEEAAAARGDAEAAWVKEQAEMKLKASVWRRRRVADAVRECERDIERRRDAAAEDGKAAGARAMNAAVAAANGKAAEEAAAADAAIMQVCAAM
jgi:hypothetical protein